jgi:hypothetical protein
MVIARHMGSGTMENVRQDLMSLWKAPFSRLDWAGRFTLLEEIDEEISTLTPASMSAQEISSALTEGLINELQPTTVTCLEQAYIYLNSADRQHRDSARLWLILNGRETTLSEGLDPDAAGVEKRKANRFRVDLDSMVSANDLQADAKLIDVSVTGAKLSLAHPLPLGTRVDLEVPFLGRIAACVVWATAAFVGLSFVVDHAMPLLA